MSKRLQSNFVIVLIIVLTCTLTILNGCLDDIRYNMPCQIPDTVERLDIVETWQLTYNNFWNPDSPSEKVSGTETLILSEDGTYTQEFRSADFDYDGQGNWELVTNEGDGPKLAMHGLKYFANGVEYSNKGLLLSLQMPDGLRYKETHDRVERNAKVVVNYPTDDFVYLYPRSCLRKFVLLQMVSGGGDPDDLMVHNPVFTKKK